MTVFIVFVLKVLPTVWSGPDSTGHEVEPVTYKVEDLLGSSSDFLNSPANLILGIFSLDLVNAGGKPGGVWLSPTSHLVEGSYTLVHGHQFQLLCYYSELHGRSG